MRSFAIGVRRWQARTTVTVTAFVVFSLAGCASNEKIKVAADGTPEYKKLAISYDLASTADLHRLDQPSAVEQTAHVEPASSSQAHPATNRPWTRQRVHLDLQYPYPGVHPAFVRATLRIVTDATPASKPDEKPRMASLFGGPTPKPASDKPDASEPAKLPLSEQEDVATAEQVLYIDLPKSEVDDLLTELAKADFFKRPSNPDGASHVVVVVNKGRCEKGWSRQEHLDRLIDLLRQHGTPLPAPATLPKKA